MQVFQNFIDSFKPRASQAVLVGEDRLGNKYYEKSVLAASRRSRPHRYYLPLSGEEDFHQELPAEWEAWLRHRRKIPPTAEELAQSYQIMLMKKENAKKLAAEHQGSKLLDQPQKGKGFESYPHYGAEYEGEPGQKLDPTWKPRP